MTYPSRWSPTSYEAGQRRAEVQRVKRALESLPPNKIKADPVVIEQALYELQREIDAEDDAPKRRR